jgi:hypothetical protein
MDNQTIRNSLITGSSPFADDAFSEAVAARFLLIKDNESFAHRDDGFCYDGNRTEAENRGWRARQTVGFALPSEQVAAGDYDEQIVIAFHEAASSEYYYRYEKDWG